MLTKLLSHPAARSVPRLTLSSTNCRMSLSLFSTSSSKSTKQITSERFPGFEPVFVSPHIKLIRTACRMKIYQTGFVFTMIPTSLVLVNNGTLLPAHVGYITAFSAFSLVVLGAMGEFFRKFIGIVYLSEDRSKVIISHNTFMGNRKDVMMDAEDIVPVSETPENVNKEILWKVSLYGNKERSYYICTKFGGIINSQKFADIFGEEIEE